MVSGPAPPPAQPPSPTAPERQILPWVVLGLGVAAVVAAVVVLVVTRSSEPPAAGG